MNEHVLKDVQTLWSYMRLNMPVHPAGCIVGFGCYDEDIPRRVAQLYRDGLAPLVVFSGGLGRNTAALWQEAEAERFRAIALAEGVPPEAVLTETDSTNSAENLLFTKRLLAERGCAVSRIIAIHKPYMERRLFAALGVYWPEVTADVTSPQVSLEAHLRRGEAAGMTRRGMLETLVGDVQRIEVYARLGYQLPQPIPEPVRLAYRRMVDRGYTGQLVREETIYL